MIFKVYYPDHKLFEYEVGFSTLELNDLLVQFYGRIIEQCQEYVVVEIESPKIEDIKGGFYNLTYFSKVEVYEASTGEFASFLETRQSLLEKSCPKNGNKKRQATRYGAHGLHEYKGKFNPQIVSAISKYMNHKPGDKLLEPFCGSGTTLYQSELHFLSAYGFDFNPLAVYIANTKLATLDLDIDNCNVEINKIIDIAESGADSVIVESNERGDYLAKWFDLEQLNKIESLKKAIEESSIDERVKNVCLCLASNLIRDYSQQEPADLRIRRRKTPMPERCFFSALRENVQVFLDSISSIDIYTKSCLKESKAFNIDIRDSDGLRGFEGFDGAITSPPYATALPYIDTQRLSLVWLGFSTPKQVKALENSLIGSRELSKREERALLEQLQDNEGDIPDDLHCLCLEMLNSIGDADGFRRRAMPFVVYRYFVDMKRMFENVLSMLKHDGQFGLVVGHNQTTLGGKLFLLDTPNYLVSIAKQVGWHHIGNIGLDVYKRYDLHKANSINVETLVLLKKR